MKAGDILTSKFENYFLTKNKQYKVIEITNSKNGNGECMKIIDDNGAYAVYTINKTYGINYEDFFINIKQERYINSKIIKIFID